MNVDQKTYPILFVGNIIALLPAVGRDLFYGFVVGSAFRKIDSCFSHGGHHAYL